MAPRTQRTLWTVGVSVSLAVLLAVGGLSLRSHRRHEENARWVAHTYQVLATLERISSGLAEAESARRGFALSSDASYLEAFQPAVERSTRAVDDARRLVSDHPVQLGNLARLSESLHQRVRLLESSIDAQRARGDVSVPAGAAELSQAVHAGVAEMQSIERRLLQVRSQASDAEAARTTQFTLFGVLASTSIITGAFLAVARASRQRESSDNALRRQNALVAGLIEGTSDPIYVKDGEGRYVLINRAAAALIGKPASDVVGRTAVEVVPAALAHEATEEDLRVMRERRPITTESSFRNAAGAMRTFMTTRSPNVDENGVVSGVIGIARDITERKASEEARVKDATLLLEMGEILMACRTLDEAFSAIARYMPRFAPELSGALAMFHASRNVVEVHTTWGEQPPSVQGALFSPDECWALRRGQSHAVEDTSVGTCCTHLPKPPPPATLCVPFVAQGEVLGVLLLGAARAIDENQRRRVALVAEQVGMAVANLLLRETLRNQSIRDPLTGLFNRRYLEETLDREIRRAARSNETFCVVMIDVDHFKRFNDTFGHAAGDVVLKELASVLVARTRGGDVAARLGGEELLVLLPGSDSENAAKRAEDLRGEVERLRVSHNGKSLGSLTISLGIAQFPRHGARGSDLIASADVALYKAKADGRNRVVLAE